MCLANDGIRVWESDGEKDVESAVFFSVLVFDFNKFHQSAFYFRTERQLVSFRFLQQKRKHSTCFAKRDISKKEIVKMPIPIVSLTRRETFSAAHRLHR